MANLLQKGLVLVIVGLFTVGSALAQDSRECVIRADTPPDVARQVPVDPNSTTRGVDQPEATSAQTPTREEQPPCAPGTPGCTN